MILEESLNAVALSFLKGISGASVKQLLSMGYGPDDVFGSHASTIPGLEWISDYDRSNALKSAREEIRFMTLHHITPLFIDNDDYPRLLAESGNPPIILYMLGNCNLNPDHSISIVGTRKSTPAGNDYCRRLTSDIASVFPDTLIVSGLAYGIDAAAHNGALAAKLPTVGVLAHGLDTIYPADHRGLASTILQHGGALLTEYPHGTRPFRNHFLERNRIVATMTQGVILAESPVKGGAMSTASIAFSYSRDVMAIPGRPTDVNSNGCNELIKTNKAHLIQNVNDIINVLGWQKPDHVSGPAMSSLFPELTGEVKIIYDCLASYTDPINIDTIAFSTSLPIVQVMTLLTDMEFDGLVRRHPGNRYERI